MGCVNLAPEHSVSIVIAIYTNLVACEFPVKRVIFGKLILTAVRTALSQY